MPENHRPLVCVSKIISAEWNLHTHPDKGKLENDSAVNLSPSREHFSNIERW